MTSTDTVALLVVGGGPAGRSAAAAYRDHGGGGRVLVLSADTAPPYFRPALSKEYLRGEAELSGIGLAARPEYEAAGIELRLAHPVAAVRPGDRRAELADGSAVRYESCVLATGATPAVLPVPGAADDRVASLRSVRDAEALRGAAARARRVVVIGSGFIGCEAAASLAGRGLDVTVVSQEPVPQAGRLGEQAGERIAGWLRELGVRLIGGASVAGIEDGTLVRLDGGRDPVRGDLVLAATGITPTVPLAEDAGADVNGGRVVVSASMRGSVAGLYAAGDAAYAYNAAAGRHLAVEHWGEAMAMGEVAGASAAGATREWAQAPGFWSEIGSHAIKYAAWGDDYAGIRFDDHGGGAFTAWYLSEDDRVVGVLTHQADDDYEHGRDLVETGGRLPAASGRP